MCHQSLLQHHAQLPAAEFAHQDQELILPDGEESMVAHCQQISWKFQRTSFPTLPAQASGMESPTECSAHWSKKDVTVAMATQELQSHAKAFKSVSSASDRPFAVMAHAQLSTFVSNNQESVIGLLP